MKRVMKGNEQGNNNYFATKKVFEGSFDGVTWYGAGDHVYYVDSNNKLLRSVILRVEYDGSILVENENGVISCSTRDLESGRIVFGEESKCDHNRIIAARDKDQFTIDLFHWFEVGQRYCIRTNDRMFIDARITNVIANGNICITCDDVDDIIHYTEIMDIVDYYDSTRYLYVTGKLGKPTGKNASKRVKSKMKECY